LVKLNLRTTLLVGTAVRLVLMPFTAHPFDVYAWYTYCMDVLRNGFDINILYSVRPLWMITLTFIALIYGGLSSLTGWTATAVTALPASFNPQYGIEWIPGLLFNTLVKVPMLLADIGTALILYRLMRRYSRTGLDEKVVALYYLNPMSIWISAGWGQYDSIPTFFTVLSVYFLLSERIYSSSVSLLFATLFKVYPAALIISGSVYLFKKRKRGALFKYFMVFIAPYAIYLGLGGLQGLSNLSRQIFNLLYSRVIIHDIFGFGLTYWSWSMVLPLDPSVWAPVCALLMIALFGISLYSVLKAKFDDPLKSLSMATFLVAAAFFLSIRIVSEARFIWLLPFIVLIVGEGAVSIKPFGLISLVAFLYTQKNFPYYLLPVATLNINILSPLFNVAAPFGNVVQEALLPTFAGGFILATLGILFSFILLSMYLKVVRAVAFVKT